ncbi:MAG TPA: GNAT family N-acetyltransferase [Ruania sp.]|nr:GNAT family N-acetyltransferase [Ruania sp.]
MSEKRIEVVAYQPVHRERLLDLAIRAWTPVFPRMEGQVPDFVYRSFYPHGWQERQRADLATVLDAEPANVDVALDRGGLPVGWVCTRLHDEDSMGEVYVIVVDPDRQGAGVGRKLLARAYQRARDAGMGMMMVETGDDSGHRPARALYEADGFVRWPVARYFKDLRRGE